MSFVPRWINILAYGVGSFMFLTTSMKSLTVAPEMHTFLMQVCRFNRCSFIPLIIESPKISMGCFAVLSV